MNDIDLKAPIVDLTAGDPLSSWHWLVPDAPVPMMVTALGDVFVRTQQEEVWFLDTYQGLYLRAAADEQSWRVALRDPTNIERWFAPDLVSTLRESGLHPAPDECYSPILPLAVGGTMEAVNFECSPWLLHMSLSAQTLEQARTHEDGASIAAFSSEGAARTAVAPDAAARRR
ncbi:MAG: hypothetical protein JWM82_2071 [Myxococcales bacterium]|nr:hypothetical protein [Myxococcales bacterium]